MSSILNDDKDIVKIMELKAVLFDLFRRQEMLKMEFDNLEKVKQEHLKILNQLGE